MLARPRLAGSFPVDLAAQQELPDSVSGAHQILANVLAAAHQVAQLLTLDRRDRDQRQLAGGQQPGQANRVALIGLDPMPPAGGRSCPARTPPPRSLPPARGARARSRSGRPHTPSAPGAPRRVATAAARADGQPPAASSARPSPGQRSRTSTRARARQDRPNGYRQASALLS